MNFNTFNLTCKCIESIYRSNNNKIDVEIIIVDNASNEVMPCTFKEIYPDIIFIQSKNNIGFAKGNNIGIQKATKDYILILNSDTVIHQEDTLYNCIVKLQSHNSKAVLSTALLTEEGDYQVNYCNFPSLLLEFFSLFFLYKFFPPFLKEKLLVTFHPKKERIFNNGYLVATFYLFKKDLLEALPNKKLYDDIFLYGEELFWAYNWKKNGVSSIYFPSEKITHIIGASSKQEKKSSNELRKAYQINSLYKFLVWRNGKIYAKSFFILLLLRYSVIALKDEQIRILKKMVYYTLTNKLKKVYPKVENQF